jgi:hypothetical protein
MADGRRRRTEIVSGIGTVVLAFVLAVSGVWPFARPRLPDEDAAIWEVLVYDGAVLGFLKLALVMLSLYGIASVPALVAGGRWAKGLGASGVIADDATRESELTLAEAERTIRDLQERQEEFERRYHELEAMVDAETAPR